MSAVIGREREVGMLQDALDDTKSQLIAVYGRRRVGKTYLIREFYKDQIVFEFSGLHNGTMPDQLARFNKELSSRNYEFKKDEPESWLNAFFELEYYINGLRSRKKKVIFIDEFPWIATQRSGFLMGFEYFWNSYVEKRNDLVVVICGSAASYMVKKVIRNRGGLYNRISKRIRLMPFNLYETALFLKSRKINYTPYDILLLYMALGGIPHYLEKLKRGYSVAQNIDLLCFEKNAPLRNEFDLLLASLFNDSERHKQIIETLAKVRKGVTRKKLIESSKITSGGDVTLKLEELIHSGFVTRQYHFKNRKKLMLYRLSDEHTLFYLKFMQKNSGKGTWQQLSKSRSFMAWAGFSFETLCLKHIQQIKKGLEVQAIYSINGSWFNENAQVDLLIDRADNVINLCEIKFTQSPFVITKSYYENLRRKRYEFQTATNTRKSIFLTMISTFGVQQNPYSLEVVVNELTMDCLFEPD